MKKVLIIKIVVEIIVGVAMVGGTVAIVKLYNDNKELKNKLVELENKTTEEITTTIENSTDDIPTENETITTKKKNTKTITISNNNWNQYFEFYDFVEWKYNAFNEVDGMNLTKGIRLKKEYYGRIGGSSEIAFEVKGTIIDKLLIPDYPNKKYTIQKKTWTGGLGDGISHDETTSITLTEDNYKGYAYVYSCADGYSETNGVRIIQINIIENANVVRVQGTLVLYDN